MMSDLCYSVVEVGDDEYITSWSNDLFFLSLDPVYLKVQKFKEAVDDAKRNLENGQAQFDFYMKNRNAANDWGSFPDLTADHDGLEISRWNIYREMLELALRGAKYNLSEVKEEASCIIDFIAASSWRVHEE
jgi:hypothetical protein